MKSYILLIASIILTNLSFAQENVLNGLKKKAKNKVEAQDFNTTRNNRQNLNKESSKKTSEEAPSGGTSAPPPAPSVDTVQHTMPAGNYKEHYDFNATLTYNIEAGKKNEVKSVTYNLGVGCFRAQMSNNMSMIFDSDNKVMITVMEENKMAMVSSSDKMKSYQQNATQKDPKNYKITKTGKTKTILGYTCEEIISESEDGKTIMWVAKNTGIDASEAFASYFATNMKTNSSELGEGGLLMEMTSFDKKGEQTAHMLATAVAKEASSFSLSGYKVTTL